MKKILRNSLFVSTLSIFSLSSVFGADFSSDSNGDLISRPHRIFEIGIDSNTGFANSSFGLADILKKEIEIDLKKIASDMPDDGFSLEFYNREKVFVDLNISSRFRFSAFAGVEATSRFGLSKDLFDLLASGISLDESKTVDVSGFADVFMDMGVSFQTLIKGWAVKITPTYFVPLIYIPKTTVSASVSTNSDGEIVASAKSPVNIYTQVNLSDFMDDKSFDNLNLTMGDILSNGGFDFSLELERNWFHNFNAGLYTRIPIVGGTLNYKMSTIVYANFYEKNLLDYIETQEKPEHDGGYIKPSTFGTDDQENGFDYTEESYKAHRPLRLGLQASYSPFGQWFKIQPMVGFGMRNPYSSGERVFYPEYALDFRLSLLWKIFNFNVGTAYQNQIFQQRAGLSLNFRALEIIAQASWCGTTFASSFSRDGYGAMVGVRIGF